MSVNWDLSLADDIRLQILSCLWGWAKQESVEFLVGWMHDCFRDLPKSGQNQVPRIAKVRVGANSGSVVHF